MSYCYKIVLDNYYESRSAMWQQAPLSSAPISSPDSGLAPPPWELAFPTPSPFTDSTETTEVPFTDVVRSCSNCLGAGFPPASSVGKGRSLCGTCRGSGSRRCTKCKCDGAPCEACNGTGEVYCGDCQGLGDVTCRECEGKGKVRRYVVVKSECRTHTIRDTIERGGLTKEYLALLEGKQVYCVQGKRLEEGECFYDSAVNDAIRSVLYEAERVREVAWRDR